jgi:AcrR family transcriptional regulator
MQRRRLLLACTEVVAEGGVEGASVARICHSAGVSRRTFYDLFDDREACVLAAFERAIEQLARRVVPVYAREGRWRERVRGALIASLECLDEEPALARLCLVEALKGGPGVLERRRAVLDALAAAVDEGREGARSDMVPPLTGESVVGGVLAVVHARLLARDVSPLVALAGPLASMIVHPYLGPVAARRELERPTPIVAVTSNGHARNSALDPFKDLPIRITFRTALVLATIAAQPGASNKDVGKLAGVADQGQMSKLLGRLEGSGLIENQGGGHLKGERNAWRLTGRGQAVQSALAMPSAEEV